ncbi:Protein argonaute-2 [Leucoagaricus sp. SymC.cos]|nr:Protein argonaute-2 [Leucoagaricus sp. SymC.cos]
MSSLRGRGRGFPDRGRSGFPNRGRAGPPDRGRGGFSDRGRGGHSPASSDSGFRGRGGSRGGRGAPPSIYAPPGRSVQIDHRLRDTSQDKLVASFKNVKINDTDLPLRPDYGEEGRKIALRTNFFPISIPKGPFYEYKVTITPATSIRRVKRRILELAEDTQVWQATLAGSVAHDHSEKMVSRKRLPQPLTIRVPFYDEDEDPPAPGAQPRKEYTLSINFVCELETDSLKRVIAGDPQYRTYDIMPIVSAFNLILAAYPSRSGGGGVTVGRNKFFMPSTSPSQPLGGGLEAVRGFYSSVRTAHNQLMVNVNVCTTAFYKPGNLAEALNEFMRMSFSARATAFVKGLRVRATHLGYRKTISKVTQYTANNYRFDSGEYGEVSVTEYFLKKYKIKLKWPDLPLVDVGGQKINFLPFFFEILPNQPFRGKLLDEHTANMIKYATNPPNVNAQTIENQGLQELGLAQNTPTLTAFGVGVGTEMATVPGRILKAPRPKYFQGVDGGDFKPDKASWNLRKVKFAKATTLENWAVLLIRDDNHWEFEGPKDPVLADILKGFMDMCKTSGLSVNSQPLIAQASLPKKDRGGDPTRTRAIEDVRKAMQASFKQKPKMILIILSDSDRHVYSGLKYLCDVRIDVPTVCVQANKIRDGGPQYYANVALKINMKLGGVNHTLDAASLSWLKQKSTMLVGMDVTHPGPGSVRGTPSIAAVVASTDNDHFAQFPASLRMQESKKEMITDLEEMMIERLKAYQARNKNGLPERILVYRDGVSEGQFATVIEQEMPPMIAAFRRMNVKYRPKLTIVVCGKRHHTRFFPTNPGDADNKANPLPGAAVDRGITSVCHFDFYLQAHGSLQGSSKPTHYFIIHDEIGFTQDQLQALTNSISYMFARATKAVSLVSPAYYADLACERGRCYLQDLFTGRMSGGVSASSGTDDERVLQEARTRWRAGPTGRNIKDIMFYL